MEQTINDILASTLKEWSEERLANAKTILERYGIGRRAQLPQSLTFTDKANGNVISVDIFAPDYYTFVDEGVKGLKNEKPNTGRYSFKTPFVSKRMVAGIRDWIPRKGIVKRGQGGSKTADYLAYAIARSVKQKGLRKTSFWSDTFNQQGFDKLGEMIGERLGDNYTIEIK